MERDDATSQEASERRRLIAEAAESFAQSRLPLARSRALRGTIPEFDAAVYAQFAESGWIGMLAPEALGGHGLGLADMKPVIQALAARLAPEPLVPAAVAAVGLLAGCDPADRRDSLLASVIDGRSVPGLAWQHPSGTLPDTAAPFSASREGSTWIVRGESRFVRPGSGATGYLLLAHAEDRCWLMECPLQVEGLRSGREPLADGTSLGYLRAQEIRIPAASAMSLRAASVADVLNRTLVMNAVELLGLMSSMRLMTLEYLKTRVQFGRAIGSFQALQHRAVDMLLQEELSAAVIDDAIAALDGPSDATEAAMLASRAKARAAHAALHIAKESMQMHGAIGTTEEYDLSLYVNRTLALAPWLGNAAHHRERFGLLDHEQTVATGASP